MPVDYAVKMKPLDEKRMLDTIIKNDLVTPELIKTLGEKIAGFHLTTKRGHELDQYGSVEIIRKNTRENFSQVKPFIGETISRRRFKDIKEYTEEFLMSETDLFQDRIKKNFIRDCHGDIHSEQIAVGKRGRISIFDCIEFAERFRCSDVVADSAFLSMDLEFRSRGDLTRLFDKAYFALTGDRQGKRLLNFYKCYRAFVRGKVESFRLTEKEETKEDKRTALLNAVRYFRLAHLYATGGGHRPTMIIMCGLSGTGKGFAARALSDETGIAVLSTDVIRKEIFSIPKNRHIYTGFQKNIYSKAAKAKIYKTLIKKSGEYLKAGRGVILDATFSSNVFLKAAKSEAGKRDSFFYVIECTAPERVIKERIKNRSKDKDAVSDATWEIYKNQKKHADKIIKPDMRLNTNASADVLSERIVKKLFYMRH